MNDNHTHIKTRKLTAGELSRVRRDLLIRGILSLFSAAMIVVFGIVLTAHGAPLFAYRGNAPLCIGAIWIAVIAMDFGLIRNGLQFFAWRKARHKGVPAEGDNNPPSLFEDIFNIVGAILFVGFGIAVLVAGRLGLESVQTLPQLPLSLLSISFGLSSAESAAIHFWFRSAGLADVIHELD